jgi:hypothetical protein
MWMNGFIKTMALGLCLGGGLTGCCYRDLVDICYPTRYNYMARAEVAQAVYAQADNGHVLDQTVWNHFFETDQAGRPTDKLNALGRQRLTYLAQRRPNPDPHVYLQTAQDLAYLDSEGPEKFNLARADLDNRRLQSVHRYLIAQTAGRNLGYDFHITVHDPGEPSLAATPIGGNQPATVFRVFGAVPQLYGQFIGTLPANVGGLGIGGGGGGGGGAAAG